MVIDTVSFKCSYTSIIYMYLHYYLHIRTLLLLTTSGGRRNKIDRLLHVRKSEVRGPTSVLRSSAIRC